MSPPTAPLSSKQAPQRQQVANSSDIWLQVGKQQQQQQQTLGRTVSHEVVFGYNRHDKVETLQNAIIDRNLPVSKSNTQNKMESYSVNCVIGKVQFDSNKRSVPKQGAAKASSPYLANLMHFKGHFRSPYKLPQDWKETHSQILYPGADQVSVCHLFTIYVHSVCHTHWVSFCHRYVSHPCYLFMSFKLFFFPTNSLTLSPGTLSSFLALSTL